MIVCISIHNDVFIIVFMSPELAVHAPWRNIFQTTYFKRHLALVAVDEAHCIPEWLGHQFMLLHCHVWVFRGSDFRTSFRRIGGLRALTSAPFMALSASAPPTIAKAIEESLHLKAPVSISHSLDRPNIYFSFSKSKGLAVSFVTHVCILIPPSIYSEI